MLVQRETKRGRSLLVSISPCGRGFPRHEGLSIRCGLFGERVSEAAALRSFIVSMSPPDYSSAWLRPRCAASVSPGEIVGAPPGPARPTSGYAVTQDLAVVVATSRNVLPVMGEQRVFLIPIFLASAIDSLTHACWSTAAK